MIMQVHLQCTDSEDAIVVRSTVLSFCSKLVRIIAIPGQLLLSATLIEKLTRQHLGLHHDRLHETIKAHWVNCC